MRQDFQSTMRWGEAALAVRAILRNPDDTAQAFRVADALKGRAPQRLLARLERSESGARLLGERRRLLDALRDRARLEALPEGSLGRAYLAFLDSEGVTAAGLVDASHAGRSTPDDEAQAWLEDHLRDQHDLWHAVTGYRGDLLGEASLLAFTFVQTKNAGIGALVAMALLHTLSLEGNRLILGGLWRGVRAAWLPEQDWEALLPLPLDEVRRRLRVTPAPSYEPFRSSELPAGGVTLRTAAKLAVTA